MSDTAQGSRVGSQFGPYHLKRLLGRGGMGEVYEAEDTVKDRVVALKLMSATFSQDPVFRKRMQREAHTAGRLQEPHVVPIHDYGEIDGQLYLDMRLIEGTDLDALLKRFGPLEPPRAVAIIRQIASALDAAHAAGVMHRDVKPQNILITRDDFAYLVDFGIASATTDERLTQLGTAVGTWKYMAPERLSNDEVTYRADIYALTCVLHECLTGSPPYRADSASVLVTAHLHEPIPRPSQERPSIPKAFDEVIARGMAKKPEDRYASAGDLALAAHQALSTPDQDQAATLLRQSQEAVLPGAAATLAPTFVPSPPPAATPTPTPAASTASPDPAGSGPLPRSTPPPTLTWAPDSGPIPAGGQPAASPQFLQGGGWPGQTATPPPPQPSSPPSWTQPSPRKPNPWLLLGIAALVVVAVLGGLGIWLATRPTPPPAPTRHPTTTPVATPPVSTAPPTPSPANAQAQLLNLLPSGYPPGTCTAQQKPMPGVLASVRCGPNTDPNGPALAVYGLFPDVASLKDAFNGFTGTVALVSCTVDIQSPGPWHQNDTPNVPRGMLACGTYKDTVPQVMWTNEDNLVFALVAGSPQGPTLDQLYTWWTTHS